MVLYHIGHYGALSQCITHKLTFHKNEETVFLLDETLSSPMVKEFVHSYKKRFYEQGIAKFLLYSDLEFTEIQDKKLLENKINDTFDYLLRKNGIRLDRLDVIYSAFDTFNAFGVYLCMKKQPFIMMELGLNQLEMDRYEMDGDKAVYRSLIKEYRALSSDNKYVSAVLRKARDNGNKILEKDILIDYQKLEEKFSDEDINKILTCFDMTGVNNVSGRYNLLVCSSYWIIFFLHQPFNYYREAYNLLIDFCGNASLPLVIKTHPSADFERTKWECDDMNIDIIHGEFPSGYLPLLKDMEIDTIISTGSTGVEKMYPNAVHKNFSLIPYFREFKYALNLYISLDIAGMIKTERTRFHAYGIDSTLVLDMAKNVLNYEISNVSGINTSILKNDTFIIINGVPARELKNFVHALCNSDIDTKVIFLNQTGENIILPCIEQNPELADNIVPVSIQKGYSTQKDSQQYIRTQRPMYFFCKNASIRNKVTSYILEKNFKYSGFVLRARGEIGLDIEERLRMEAQALRNSLKNTQERLDALEKRINDYIK